LVPSGSGSILGSLGGHNREPLDLSGIEGQRLGIANRIIRPRTRICATTPGGGQAPSITWTRTMRRTRDRSGCVGVALVRPSATRSAASASSHQKVSLDRCRIRSCVRFQARYSELLDAQPPHGQDLLVRRPLVDGPKISALHRVRRIRRHEGRSVKQVRIGRLAIDEGQTDVTRGALGAEVVTVRASRVDGSRARISRVHPFA
jgi:hypothetical protein